MTNKKCITSYDRKKVDWGYIEYLEYTIKELKEENKQIKEDRRSLNKRNSQLSNDLFWSVEELKQSEQINELLKEKIVKLENKPIINKQSLL